MSREFLSLSSLPSHTLLIPPFLLVSDFGPSNQKRRGPSEEDPGGARDPEEEKPLKFTLSIFALFNFAHSSS